MAHVRGAVPVCCATLTYAARHPPARPAEYGFFDVPREQANNDVGMLGLTTAVPVTPINLASSRPAPGDVLYLAGYGRVESGENGAAADTLMITDMMAYDLATCTEVLPWADTFCAGMADLGGGSDGGVSCNGDSGGPAVNMDGQVTGIVSYGGKGCTLPYSYYTAVADQLDHINGMMQGWTSYAA